MAAVSHRMVLTLGAVFSAALYAGAQAAQPLPPEAQKIEVYDHVLREIVDCQKLGTVTGQAANAATPELTNEAATDDLRMNAATKLKADSVAVIDTEKTATGIAINAYAYICFPK